MRIERIEEMKQRKAELGYTNEQIAKLSGVPLSTVQKIFAGVTRRPRYDTLLALETVLLPGNHENESLQVSRVREKEFCYGNESAETAGAGDGGEKTAAVKPASRARKKQGEYTLEDYYGLTGDRRAELIEGVIYYLATPSLVHQSLVLELGSRLKSYIKENSGKCFAAVAPLDVHLHPDDEKNILEPDVFVVCDRGKMTMQRIEGAPDLVIEILSPSTRKRDMGIKYAKYLEAGVREYWIVDPDSRKVVVYVMETDQLPRVFTFDDKVPVFIFDGNCSIDFSEIQEETEYLYGLEE